MKYIYILLMVVVGCSDSEKENHKVKAFNSFKNLVDIEVFKSFPISEKVVKNSFSQNIIYPDAIYASGYCGIFLNSEYSEENYKMMVKKFSSQKIYESSISDTCNYYIPNNMNELCSKNSIPVPNVFDDFNNLKSLESNGKFLVFNYKQGRYLKNNSLLKSAENGFSNGVLISESSNKITYWIIIW